MRLTQRTVQDIPAPSKKYTLIWDSELKGFGLRVTAGGARSFIVQKRIRGRDKRHTLGRWPALKPEQARRNAQAWLGAIASGRDPVADRERDKLSAVTLSDAFDSYLALKTRSKDGLPLKPRTKADMLNALKDSFGDWKRKTIGSISRPMVERRYRELADRSPARANIAMRYLRAVYNFQRDRNVDGEGKPLISDNPVNVLKRQWRAVGRRRRVLAVGELPGWVSAVNALADVPEREPGAGRQLPKLKHGSVFRDWLLFMALTGCRPIEAHEFKVDAINLKERKFVFRDTKNRSDHELPMTDFLYELLERRVAGSGEFVFASPFDGRSVSNYRYAVARVRELCGVYFSPGDMRRLASTAMEKAGVSVYTMKAILNHTISDSDDVTAGYVQVTMDMKLNALKKIEAYVMHEPAKVVSFPAEKVA